MSKTRRSVTSLKFARQESKDATKPEVVGIAIAATIIVVLLIAGGLFWFFRRRRRQRSGKRNGGDFDSLDGDTSSLHKTPLMGQHDTSRTTETPVTQYDGRLSPPRMQRSTSTSTSRSLPPAYASIARSGPNLESLDIANEIPSMPRSHRSTSSRNGSDGLRPLMLVEAQNSYGEIPGHRSNDRNNSSPSPISPDTLGGADTLSLQPSRSTGRPRATSRFREEDI